MTDSRNEVASIGHGFVADVNGWKCPHCGKLFKNVMEAERAESCEANAARVLSRTEPLP